MTPFETHSAAETIALGRRIGQALSPNTLLCLNGDLGAGKTTLSKGIISGITGIQEEAVTSPTFIYLNEYPAPLPAFHFDLYRITDADEFLAMGFDEYFHCGGVCLIEWSERITPLLPPTALHLSIETQGPQSRLITLEDGTKLSFVL